MTLSISELQITEEAEDYQCLHLRSTIAGQAFTTTGWVASRASINFCDDNYLF